MNESIPNEQTASTAETDNSQKTGSEYTFDQFIKDVGDVAVKVVSAASKAAEEISGMVVVPVDKQTREDLDVLVDSGISKNRAQAILSLVRDGIKANQSVYSRVEHTREQIKELRNQLKSMVGQQ